MDSMSDRADERNDRQVGRQIDGEAGILRTDRQFVRQRQTDKDRQMDGHADGQTGGPLGRPTGVQIIGKQIRQVYNSIRKETQLVY